jgi:hypothetical protein
MCYAPSVQTVLQQMLRRRQTLGTGGRVVPGIAVYNSTPSAAAAKIKAAAELGFRTLALYSTIRSSTTPGTGRRSARSSGDAPRP